MFKLFTENDRQLSSFLMKNLHIPYFTDETKLVNKLNRYTVLPYQHFIWNAGRNEVITVENSFFLSIDHSSLNMIDIVDYNSNINATFFGRHLLCHGQNLGINRQDNWGLALHVSFKFIHMAVLIAVPYSVWFGIADFFIRAQQHRFQRHVPPVQSAHRTGAVEER